MILILNKHEFLKEIMFYFYPVETYAIRAMKMAAKLKGS